MNPLLKQIYLTGKVEDKDGNMVNCFPTSVPYETGRFLYDLIRTHKLKNTPEIGMAYGLSTLFICQALSDNGFGRHISIDPAQDADWQSIGLLNIERAGLNEIVRFFQCSSYDVLPKLHSEGEQFDFAFIDGMHLFDYTLVDFFYIDKMLQVGGYVVFDDIWMPAVRKAISFILRNRLYQPVSTVPRKDIRLWRYAAAIGIRLLQNPLGRDLAVKVMPRNVCVLRKLAEDSRHWTYHRAF